MFKMADVSQSDNDEITNFFNDSDGDLAKFKHFGPEEINVNIL